MSDSLEDWSRLAARRLKAIVREAQGSPTLRRLAKASAWDVQVQMVSAPVMTRLNAKYRGKGYPTDVLSFPAPPVFRESRGQLGELVICLPTLRRQAEEQGHREGAELDVLLVHGLLHLLGMDHERGKAEAARMARWERRLLKGRGLIGRSGSRNC